MALRQAVLTVFLTCILALAGCDKDKPIDIEATFFTSDIRQVLKDSDPVYASVDVSVAAGERCDEVGPALANLLRSQVYTSATYIACTNTDGDEFAVIRISVPVLWMRSSTSITNKPVAIGINTFPDEDLLRVTYVTNRAAVLALLTELHESLQLDKYEEPAFHFSALLTNDESDSVDMHVSNVFVDDTPVVTTHRITLKRRESVRIDLSNVGNAVLATEGGQVRIISWTLDLSDLPMPTPSPTLIPTATFSSASETQERTYVIGNTGGDGVYIRRTTDMADRIKAWPDGTEMVVIGPDVTAEGILWRNVRDPDGNEGFVPARYLSAAAASLSAPTVIPSTATTTATVTLGEPTTTPQLWFQGGTLHQSKITEWHQASRRNKLATAADFATTALEIGRGLPDAQDEHEFSEKMRIYAVAMVICIDESTQGLDEELTNSLDTLEVAVLCALNLGY